MKKLTIGLSIAALAMASTAYAAQDQATQNRDNATVTRADAEAQATNMFARMDANKDGKLDAADGEARRAAMFDRIDTNKDGQISRDEFSAKHRPDAARSDADGNQRKHRMGHRGGGKGWGGHGRGMMTSADTNKDNAISQAEFTAAALQRFDRTDANKDGQVTKEERQAARTAKRGQRRAPAAAAPAQPAN